MGTARMDRGEQAMSGPTATLARKGILAAALCFAACDSNEGPAVVGSIPNQTVAVGETVTISLDQYFSDPDADDLSYKATSSEEGVATASASGASLSVAAVSQGTATVRVTATDPGGLSAEQSFTVTVPNRAPEVSDPIPDAEVHVGETIDLDLSGHFADPDADDLSYAAASSDEGVATASASGASLTVAAVGRGTATVTVTATDPGGLSAEQNFTVTVPNRAPEISDSIPDAEIHVGETVDVELSGHFSDPDADDLSYAATSSEEGVATASASGATLTVAAVSQGTATVAVTATDPGGLSAEQSFTVTVPNRTPEISDSIPDAEIHVGETVDVELSGHFADPDGDDLSYAATSSDERVATASASGASLTVASVSQGTATVTVTATDPGGLSAEQTFTVTVPNRAPKVSDPFADAQIGPNDTIVAVLSHHFADPDGDDLSYSATSSDRDVVRRRLSGDTLMVFPYGHGTATVTVTATDAGDLSAEDVFEVTVSDSVRQILEAFYDAGNGDDWRVNTCWKSCDDLDDWHGVAYSGFPPRFQLLQMDRNNVSGTVLPLLGGATDLLVLSLAVNDISGSIPAELGNLTKLVSLRLARNDLSGPLPPELGNLGSVWLLWLSENRLSGPIPPELGRLGNATDLVLDNNRLSGPIPPELGDLARLEDLELDHNSLSGPIPPELGQLDRLDTLNLSDNNLSGPLPAELGRLDGLRALKLENNAELSGPVPLEFTGMTSLNTFRADGTDICAPRDADFVEWLRGVDDRRLPACAADSLAYLVQPVQDWDYPVSLIADREALLRVFVLATRANSEDIPEVVATFYVDGEETHEETIASRSGPIPTELDEGSLAKSSNADIPASVIEPGLQVVIEIDPDGELDDELLVTRRIPSEGRMSIGVDEHSDFELTVIPFLLEDDPDSSVIDIADDMEDEEEDHEYLQDTYDLLPMATLSVVAHEPVETDSDSPFDVILEVIAMRKSEDGEGHWTGMIAEFGGNFGGVAQTPGWSSAVVPAASTIAHELGHNLSLRHAPCGRAPGPDPLFPDADGQIGSYGYDHRDEEVVEPDAYDVMGYCNHRDYWISEYHASKAAGYRRSLAFDPRIRIDGPALLLWGGVNEQGEPVLKPAFVVDARSAVVPTSGPYSLTGRDGDGGTLFSVSFEMDRLSDLGEAKAFAHLLPVEAVRWGALASIELSGPEGEVTIDTETDDPMTILRDPDSGRFRAFLRGVRPDGSFDPNLTALRSRGLPVAAEGR